jgi:hypothetical protein
MYHVLSEQLSSCHDHVAVSIAMHALRSLVSILSSTQICNRLNDDRTIFNNLIFACARLVAVLLYYSTLLASQTSDSVILRLSRG